MKSLWEMFMKMLFLALMMVFVFAASAQPTLPASTSLPKTSFIKAQSPKAIQQQALNNQLMTLVVVPFHFTNNVSWQSGIGLTNNNETLWYSRDLKTWITLYFTKMDGNKKNINIVSSYNPLFFKLTWP